MRVSKTALAAFLLSATLCHAGDRVFSSYAFKKRYSTAITDKERAKAPAWLEKDDNPPVSARRAIKAADELRAKLVTDSKEFTWKRTSANILFEEDGDACYWEIRYVARFNGYSSGIPDHLNLYVLMDGTVLRPTVEPNP